MEEIIAEFLGEVRIGNFEVQEGLIQFKDERGERSNDIGFEKFSFRLEEMELFAAPQLPLVEKLSIGEIYLSLDQYRLKLRDNLHTILADKLIVDSRRQLLEVTNFSIRPENQAQIQASLDTYGKTAAIDFSVPIFRQKGLTSSLPSTMSDFLCVKYSFPGLFLRFPTTGKKRDPKTHRSPLMR
ncbi:hypothetical protein [Algoriphagus boritolerans]|uniref:hypothetical protein n=1 Tax=Algoriphagus boritolerans TaxID=308111 RepID=UPI000B232D9D